jgi:glycosyltransferase involved in cell wall biosynthesis
MKVFFIVPRFHTNMVGWINTLKNEFDCEIEVHSIVKGYTENYSDITPIVFNRGMMSSLIIKIFGDKKANSPRSFPAIFSYFNYILKKRPEYIVVRDISRYFSFIAAICGRMLGVKIIIYSQIIVHQKYSEKRLRSINLVNNMLNAFWLSPLKGDDFHEISPQKLHFVPFVIPIKNRTVKNNGGSILKLLSIGKFVERKNILLLLDAILKLRDKGYKFHLTIIGEVSNNIHSEYHDRVLNYIIDNNLSSYVDIHLNIDHNEVDNFYQNSDLFILPATREPASISVLEALANGVPVICSDNCGTKFYISESSNGFVFEDNNLDSLISKIEMFFLTKNKSILTQNCYQSHDENFSPTAFKKIIFKIFKCN